MRRRDFLRWTLATGVGAMPVGCWLEECRGAHTRKVPGPAEHSWPAEWLSHPPIRPLPTPSNRAIDEGSPAIFMAPDGSDSNSGRDYDRPVKTFSRAALLTSPGDTLYLLGGHYWLGGPPQVTFNKSGTPRAPITVRSYPGELVILDGGYPEFFESPDTAWEPCPARLGGIEGEYWSTHTYPLQAELRALAGNFGDSMNPLFRYRSMYDLRSINEYSFPGLQNNNYQEPTGIWCGPGAMWNDGTGRIHVRLAHTNLPQLRDDYLGLGIDNNYAGVTDPREIALVLTQRTVLTFKGSHLRFQDIVVQGFYRLEIGDSERTNVGIEVDGLHFYAGLYEIAMTLTGADLRMSNSKIRGYDAPWSNRFADKNRSSHSTLVQFHSTDIEIDHTEFSDHHNGPGIASSNETCDFHHNLVDNMNDDGLFLQPRHPTRVVRVFQNHFLGAVSYLPFSAGGQGVVSAEDAGVYVYRNFFDLRRGVYGGPPTRDNHGRDVFRRGLLTNEHSNSIRPDVYFYHNTIALYDSREHDYYLANLGSDYAGADFRVYNNILILVAGRPRQNIRAEPGNFESRNNLQWGVTNASSGSLPGDVHADPMLVAFSADWRDDTDIHLQAGSPAIDAGFPIPAEWPDALRAHERGAPDIGAVPFGLSGTTFGPGADL